MRRTTLPSGGSPPPASASCPSRLDPEGPYSDGELSRGVPGTIEQDGETATPGLGHARVLQKESSSVSDVRHARRSRVRRMARELSCDAAGRTDQPVGKPDADGRTEPLRGAA